MGAQLPSDNNSRPKDATPAYGTETLTVIVGTESKCEQYVVHKNIICSSSGFFSRALKHDFIEKQTEAVPLPEFEPRAFGMYQRFLYCGQFYDTLAKQTKETSVTITDIKVGTKCRDISEVIILADFLQDASVHDPAIDCIIDAVIESNRFPTAIARRVYENLPEGACLRDLIRDFWVYNKSSKWFDLTSGDTNTGPQEFWLAVAKEMCKLLKGASFEKPWEVNRCRYHLHGEDEKCYASK